MDHTETDTGERRAYDDESANEPPDTKPILIKSHGEFVETAVTSPMPADIKQEIKTELDDALEPTDGMPEVCDAPDVKPRIK